VQING
jgi:hypothetical protein